MVNYISFGEYNKNYKYIFLTCIFRILEYYLPMLLIEIFLHKKKITKSVNELDKHIYGINNFTYFGMFIFSCILHKYGKNLSKSESNIDKSNSSNSDKGCFKVVKMNDEKKAKLNNKNKKLLNVFIIVIIYCILEFLSEIISVLNIFSNWMIILLVISFINAKLFKTKTYKHQKLAIYYNFIVLFVFQLSSFILTLKSQNYNDESIYEIYNWLIPIGLITYLLYIIMISYSFSKMKWFMDFNWISLTKLFMIYSLVLFLFNAIICVILTFIKCTGNISYYFCNIQDYEDKDENALYIENISIFFKRLKHIYNEEDKGDFIFVIFYILLDIILASLFNFFFLSILKNLSPEYYFFTGSIRDTLVKIIFLFHNKIFEGYFFVGEGRDYKLPLTKFLLETIGNFLTFFGFLVYLEIIELNFWGLNFNLKKNIIKRSIEDSINEISSGDEQSESLSDDDLT